MDGRQRAILATGTALLLLSMCAFPAAQLAFNRIGPIVRATSHDLQQKRDFGSFLKTVRKPLFIGDDLYSLPWFSNGNHHPAIQLDLVFYTDAQRRGLFKGAGIDDLFRSHWFGSVYASPGNNFHQLALQAGYRSVPIPAEYTHYFDVLGREVTGGELLVSPEP